MAAPPPPITPSPSTEQPRFAARDGALLHVLFRPGQGRAVVLANALGTDLRLWDAVLPLLPADVPILRWDMRGHGLSGGPAAGIADHAEDLAWLMDRHGVSDAVVCGVSMGGLVAQALAAARPDLCAGLVLVCTAARIGTPDLWADRAASVREGGVAAVSEPAMERWFSAAWRAANPEALRGWRLMLERMPREGYATACEAIGPADLTDSTAALTLPATCVAGAEDVATPPAVVEGLAALIAGVRFVTLPGAGHLPPIEAPAALAGEIESMRARLDGAL